MYRLTIILPDRTIQLEVQTPRSAYNLIRHHRLPHPEAALDLELHPTWSVSVSVNGIGWKLKRKEER